MSLLSLYVKKLSDKTKSNNNLEILIYDRRALISHSNQSSFNPHRKFT